MRCSLALMLLGACSFEHGLLGSDPAIDGSTTGSNGSDADLPPGSEPMCVTGFLDLCGQAAPTMTIDISGSDTINTDTDPRCRTYVQTGGGAVCLVYASSVNLTGSLTATGSRPLAIVSTSTMSISGVIDVSSRRSDGHVGPSADGSCTFGAVPENDLGGAGGAAGGSFGAFAGNGGLGDSDNSLGNDGTAAPGTAGPTIAVTALRGGCRGQSGGNESGGGGQGGTGGHSGGALYLVAASTLTISGSAQIRAMGAGGEGGAVQAGGGGGGSGGLVVIEAMSISIAGSISANGGGGGEGGARVGTTPVSGQPGSDGAMGMTPAPGGMGTDNRFGYGGAGGAGTTAAVTGTSSLVAGGGGGGAVGIVALRGLSIVTGTISPPAI